MKRVDIISKVVGRDGQGKPVGGGISIPMGNYALKSDFESLKSMFNDFLEGDDTDSVINRWKDLEAFLDGISEDNTLDSILKAYVTLSGTQTIIGEKNFVGGLKVNGSPIYYDTEKKYWKLEGDLLVTGGVTMYGNDSDFVASTIMDAILYDDTTLGINSQGQLYVKGSVGGATTMGSLSNVGSWADSVASQDRIMYQAANSSQWVAKNLSDLAVGGVTGNYLPLSGGTIESSANSPLTIKRNNAYGVGITFQNTTEKIGIQAYDGLLSRVDNNNATYTIWDSGNDGSGSGLDADLLDGLHELEFFRYRATTNSFDTVLQNGSYRTTEFTPNNAYGYGIVTVFRAGETCAQLYFPDWSSEPRYRMGWNAQSSMSAYSWVNLVTSDSIGSYNAGSATKLQTARTIWGQSFDGTGNVSGYIYTSSHRLLGTYGGAFLYAGIRDGEALSIEPLDSDATCLNRGITLLKNGNVGIGTANPSLPLAIVSTKGDVVSIKTTSDTWNCIRYYPKSGTNWSVGCDTNNKFFFFSDIQNKFVAEISANGDFLVNGGITMYSDARKKTILNHVELSLQQVANAPLIEHYYNSDENKTTHVGSIAQYWAGLNDWFCKLDSEGYYTMEIQNAALASAISVARELVKFEDETDRRIRLLEEENKRLKEEIEQLKWNIA